MSSQKFASTTLLDPVVESLVARPGQKLPDSTDLRPNVVILHTGEPDYTNGQYRNSLGEPPTIVRRIALPMKLFLECAITEIAGNPNAKTMIATPDATFQVIEPFDQVASLMATGGVNGSLVLEPINPDGLQSTSGTGAVMIDKNNFHPFTIALDRGYANAGCGSAQVWDTEGDEHWVSYGRQWDTVNPYPLDLLISAGQIGKTPERSY